MFVWLVFFRAPEEREFSMFACSRFSRVCSGETASSGSFLFLKDANHVTRY